MFDKLKEMVSSITGGGDLGDLDLSGYEKYLEGISWPVSKDELVAAVQRNGAPDQIVNVLQNLDVSQLNGPEDVVSALTGSGGDAAQETVSDAAQTAQDTADDVAGDIRKTL